MEQKRASAVQRGGGDAEGASARQHSEILRLLGGVVTQRTKSYCAGHRTYDFWNFENVSTLPHSLLR